MYQAAVLALRKALGRPGRGVQGGGGEFRDDL
jgi:hypothetical protein